MTDTLTYEVQHRVAHRVASAWRRKGIRSYSYEDLYQDAIEVIRASVKNYDPAKGVLEAYLRKCCVHKLGDRLTRAVQPASTSSNSEVVQLRNLQTVRVTDETRRDGLDYDHLVWLTQVRERMLALVEEDGRVPLMVALGLVDVRDIAKSHREAQCLHQEVRRIKRRLMNDRRLFNMLKDAR